MQQKKLNLGILNLRNLNIGETMMLAAGVLTILAYLLWPFYNHVVSHEESSCRFKSWIISFSKFNAGEIVASCTLPNGEIVGFRQFPGWTPPEIGSDLTIEIVTNRFIGRTYYLKVQ